MTSVFMRVSSKCAHHSRPRPCVERGALEPDGRYTCTPRAWLAVSVAATTLVALKPSITALAGTPGDPISRLRWIDRQGRVVGDLGSPGRYWTMRLSHDGTRAVANPEGRVWVIDGRTNLRTPLTTDCGAVWPADDRRVMYVSDYGLSIRPSRGEGAARSLLKFTDRNFTPTDVSPDNTAALVSSVGSANLDLWQVTIADGSVHPFLATEFDAGQGSYSPDGQWITYSANPSGRREVYIRPRSGRGAPCSCALTAASTRCGDTTAQSILPLTDRRAHRGGHVRFREDGHARRTAPPVSDRDERHRPGPIPATHGGAQRPTVPRQRARAARAAHADATRRQIPETTMTQRSGLPLRSRPTGAFALTRCVNNLPSFAFRSCFTGAALGRDRRNRA
jgi:hypothetical protein